VCRIYRPLIFIILLAQCGFAQDKIADIENKIKHFHMDSGFCATLESRLMREYLEIVDSQLKEVSELKKEYELRANEIRDQSDIEPETTYARLQELRNKFDNELKEKILVPHQRERIEYFGIYNCVLNEGLANSMVNGSLVVVLDLKEQQRRQIKNEAEEALQEYRETVVKAQKKAIDRLKKSVPADKQKKFDDLIESMMSSDGLMWKNNYSMLEVSPDKETFAVPKIKPIR
jgi:hypothetical protein